MLAEGELYHDEPLFINRELEWLAAATPAELREVAARWMERGYYQLTVEPFPQLVSGDEGVDRSSIPEVTAKTAIQFPDIETTTLPNGIELVVAKRGNVPVIDVAIEVGSGLTAAPADAPGLPSFVFSLLDKGTRAMDAGEIAAAKDRIAMSGSFGAGVERSSLSYRILSEYLGDSFELAADMLREPTFPQGELDKMKAQVRAFLANRERAPAGAANSLFERAIYGDDHILGAVWTPALLEPIDRHAGSMACRRSRARQRDDLADR